MKAPIKILIVDDSALVREVLSRLFSQDPDLKVIGAAKDPIHAIELIKKETPDVITLDLEMPRMNGLTFLEKLMALNPLPVVVISSLTRKGSNSAIKALELGAIDFVSKPALAVKTGLEELNREIINKVKYAAKAKIKPAAKASVKPFPTVKPKPTPLFSKAKADIKQIVAIGASTGGAVAIKKILSALPPLISPLIIVLHMPADFTRYYAERLNNICPMNVKEAADNENLQNNTAYVACGGKHLLLDFSPHRGYFLRLDQSPYHNHHRPSVDKTFFSLANHQLEMMGIILTGMGNDGAQGLLKLKQNGAITIAQDEASCVVFGMPREAIRLKAPDQVLPLEGIIKNIISFNKT